MSRFMWRFRLEDSMRIQNNIPGKRGLRYGRKVNSETSKTLEKLSSGYRINRASDDAAGLAVSERIRACLTGYDRCEDNVREGIDLATTADAALQEVNDMLCRAEELCVAAANGTYTDHEREQLKEELDALYDEMDRIFESSRFNKTQLFRHEDGDYSNGEFEYIEEVIMTDPDDLRAWGVFGDIDPSGEEFELAKPAQNATVTLTLDSDVRDASDLVGKSFEIKSPTGFVRMVKFTSSGDGYTTDRVNGGYYYSLNVSDCTTVQDAFDKLCDRIATGAWGSNWSTNHTVLDKENTKVNGNTVTLAFKKETLSQSVTADGSTKIYETLEGDGTKSNGVVISSNQELVLSTVDSTTNNFTVSATFRIVPGKADSDLLTADMKARLVNNSFTMGGYTISFTNGSGSGRSVDVSAINTVGELRAAVVAAANTISGVSVSAPANDGTITITQSNYSSGAAAREDIRGTSQSLSTSALSGITVSEQPAGTEKAAVATVILPTSFTDVPFSVEINGSTYHFYDSSKLPAGYTVNSSSLRIDINGKSVDEIHELIYSNIYNRYYSDATATRSGNTVTLTAKVINKPLNVRVNGVAGSFSIYPNSDFVLLESGGSSYAYQYYQNYSFEFNVAEDMSGGFDAAALTDRGFKLNGTWYQFVTAVSAGTLPGAVAMDVSSCTSYDDIANVMQTAIAAANSNVAVVNNNGVLTVSGTYINSSSSALQIQDGRDGVDGLFGNTVGVTQSAVASGGTHVGNPTATINFSKYSKSNFRELYGKGFRVTCATCEGEYINVIFCYDKAQCSFPASFEKQDDISGEIRTIHNLAVELKGMNSGSDIVQSIVDQLGPELDHYTGVEVGTPSSVLKIFDKRPGNILDPNSSGPLRAEILSGVYTNCIYTVQENFYAGPDDFVGDIGIDYRQVRVYADAESVDHYIDIHLPYLTLENLKLNPPEPDLSTPEAAAETMKRVLNANNAISSMRGVLGADYNRLEHAAANLAQAAVQAADAYSRIRDADMAEMMTQRVKESILQQAQQAAQAHAIKLPQQVLSLIQS